MDVRLSTEQQSLQQAAARLAGDLGPAGVGDLDDRARVARLDAAVADAGWRQLRTADDDGRPWASGVEVGIVAEELGRRLADTPFLGPTLAAELRRLAGLPEADDPETVLLTADLGALAESPEGALAVDCAGAAHALHLTPIDGGWTLSRVPIEPLADRVDLTRPVGTPLEATAHGNREPLPPMALGPDGVARVTALGLAITCADLVGTMHGAVDLSVEYASQRHQYGQAIGSFQAVQHLLADALVATEGSRSLARHAAWAVDALPPAAAWSVAALAKAYCARAARDVGETAIQVHGGIGNTWECLAHVHLRRALLSDDVLGGVDANLERVLADRLAPRTMEPS